MAIEKLFLVAEVAKIFEVREATIRLWIKQGRLRAIKTSEEKKSRWYIPESAVEELAHGKYGNGPVDAVDRPGNDGPGSAA